MRTSLQAHRIRVETSDYFLRRYREDVIARRIGSDSVEQQLIAFERELRARTLAQMLPPAPHMNPELVSAL